jgi:hypothetical protein
MQPSRHFQYAVEEALDELLNRLGTPPPYLAIREFKGSALHWPDVVWFEQNLPDSFRPHGFPGVPVAAFEAESSRSMQSIKGAIANLEQLKPAVGFIVIPKRVSQIRRTIEVETYGGTVGESVCYLARLARIAVGVLTYDEESKSLEILAGPGHSPGPLIPLPL